MSSNATEANVARSRGSAPRRSIPWTRVGLALLASAAALATAGCEATLHPSGPFAVTYADGNLLVRAEVVPPNIWAYPHVRYGRTFVYLVDGVWYYPSPDGWMIFRREPVELSRERTQMGQGRYRAPYYGYPDRYRDRFYERR
ncbi:MAG: hypothetical protein QM820_36200 [Minicystis sp.]